jgi:hypothetical protein
MQDVVSAKMIFNPMQQPFRLLYLNDIQRFSAFFMSRTWQVIKGFDSFHFREVFSIYRKSTLNGDEARGSSLSAQDGLFPLFQDNTSVGGEFSI